MIDRNRKLCSIRNRAALVFALAGFSIFDKDAFMNVEVTEQGATDFTPIPDSEYNGVIESLNPREQQGPDGTFHVMDVVWMIDDPSLEAITGLKKNKVRQGLFVDLTHNGGLDMGKNKNVQLNRLRDVFGQNQAGQVWRPSMLIGQAARIKTASRQDDKTGRVYTDVKSVTKLG